MSKQFIAMKGCERVAGPCSLEELPIELEDSGLDDEELARVVVYALVPAYTVKVLPLKLTPIRAGKPAKKGR